jgi:hypothetical protein
MLNQKKKKKRLKIHKFCLQFFSDEFGCEKCPLKSCWKRGKVERKKEVKKVDE